MKKYPPCWLPVGLNAIAPTVRDRSEYHATHGFEHIHRTRIDNACDNPLAVL